MFIVLHLINGKDLEPSPRIRFLEEMTCEACLTLLGKISNISCYSNSQLVKERIFLLILLYTLVLLNHKFGKWKKSIKCTKNLCRKVINVGTECIVIEGAPMVSFNMNKIVAQKFYYCLDALCITNRPPWTNVWPLLDLTFDYDITDNRKKEIFNIWDIFIWI